MTAPIIDLLSRCGVSLPSDDTAWQRLVVLNNVGLLPGDGGDTELLENRGFNMLVVDEAGVATHFCKWRANPAESSINDSVVARHSRTPALRAVVPETWVVRTDEIVGEVSRYLHGELLSELIGDMQRVEMRDALVAIVASWEQARTSIVQLEPSVVAGTSDAAFIESAANALAGLRAAGCPQRDIDVLASALVQAGAVQHAPQHGDLWPRNILRVDGKWVILDFEFFARVQVPLYDACHLVRTTWDARAGRTARTTWIDELASDSAESHAYKHVLTSIAARLRLTPAQAGGALVFYVVDVAARIHRRSRGDFARYLAEVRRLARWIAGGRRPEDLLTESSGANANDRLARAPFGRVEGGNGIVEGSDGADVRPQSPVADSLDDLT